MAANVMYQWMERSASHLALDQPTRGTETLNAHACRVHKTSSQSRPALGNLLMFRMWVYPAF